MKELESRIAAAEFQAKASQRKKRRDVAIHDHRAGKDASVKDILGKGKLEKLR